MTSLRILVFSCITAATLAAQQGSISGPLTGYVFDRGGKTLRPIRGIPGASLVGEALNPGFDLASADVSPRQDSAVLVAADGAVHAVRLRSGTMSALPIDGIAGSPERVVFSPSGSALAIYARGRLQVVTGLPDAPVRSGTVELLPGSGAAVEALSTNRLRRNFDGSIAISDDGAYILASTGGGIQLLALTGANRKLMDARSGALVAFAPRSHDAAVADSAGAGLVWFHDVAGSSDARTVAATDGDIASPTALAFAPNGQRLFLARSMARSVTAFDLVAGTRKAIACSCAPAGLTAMGDLFRLNEPGAEPIWLLDVRTNEPQLLFVPASAGSDAQSAAISN